MAAGVPKKKIHLVPNGADLSRFDFKRSKNKKFICIYVGIIEKRKGVEYLLKAWDELSLPNSELILCGLVNLSLKRLVKKYEGRKDVRFLGFTDPLPYYKKADAFILPSLFEGSAKVIYEAMASSLPIIATN